MTGAPPDTPSWPPGEVPVLHVINGDFYAGAERVQELLARQLPVFGYQASFACLKRGEFERWLRESQHPSVTVPMRSRVDVLGAARRVAQHAAICGSRLLHSHTPRGSLVASLAARMTGLPLVHHVHSPTSRDTARPVADRLNALLERAALKRAAALVPVSQSLADYLVAEGHPRERISVVRNGVAVDDAPPPDPGGPLTLGMVALFRPRKGIEVLLRALAHLRSLGIDFKLLAVGDFETEPYRDEVLGLCKQLALDSCVEWLGFRKDVRSELRRMHTLVLPSLYGEGLPMVVLEAMAVGVPVVATRVEGVPEVVRHGVEGLLVSPHNVGELSETLVYAWAHRDELRELGIAGQRRQRSVFSDLAMARGLSRVYDAVLGRRPGAPVPRTAVEGVE